MSRFGGKMVSSREDAEGRRKARAALERIRRRREKIDDIEGSNSDESGAEDFSTEGAKRLLRPFLLQGEAAPSEGQKVALLKRLFKLWKGRAKGTHGAELNDFKAHIILCLRIPLADELSGVRSAALRLLRGLVRTEQDVENMVRFNIHYLVARSLDLDWDKLERIQAIMLARRMLYLAPKKFPAVVVRSLASIARGSCGKGEERDRSIADPTSNACLSVLCELSVLNVDLFISCRCVLDLTASLLHEAMRSMAKMAEAVVGTLLRLFSSPETRNEARIQVEFVLAPFTEFHFVLGKSLAGPGGDAPLQIKTAEDRTSSLHCGGQAILCLLRSWGGLTQLMSPDGKRSKPPLATLVNSLYLKNAQIRVQVMELLSEALGLPVLPDQAFAEGVEGALAAISDPEPSASWKLAEGFVAAEGHAIVPHLMKSRPNLLEVHRSLLVRCLLHVGLDEALENVIVTAEPPDLSVRATVLLGEFLHLVFLLLPLEVTESHASLPTLISQSGSSSPEVALRSSEAAAALTELQLKRRGTSTRNLFLLEILAHSNCPLAKQVGGRRLERLASRSSDVGRCSKSDVVAAVGDSQVLTSEDKEKWKWEIVQAVFKHPFDQFLEELLVEDGQGKGLRGPRDFLGKVLGFFKPSSNEFTKVEVDHPAANAFAKTGCALMEFLAKSRSDESQRLLDDMMLELKRQLGMLGQAGQTAARSLLVPSRLGKTACQFYFLFFGRLSRSPEGRAALDRHRFMETFNELAFSNSSDFYSKLIVTSLDYSEPEWGSRDLLARACREGEEARRIYATKFLGLLVRCKTPYVTSWGVDLIVGQLFDKSSKVIPWLAYGIVCEACEDQMNLEAVKRALASCGTFPSTLGATCKAIIDAHLISSPNGIRMSDEARVEEQLRSWRKEFNVKYVLLVDGLITDGLTHHQLDEEREYGRRSSDGTLTARNIFVPPHLYGQLASTPEGADILSRDGGFRSALELIEDTDPEEPVPGGERAAVDLKAAVWAVSHVVSAPRSDRLIQSRAAVVRKLVLLAESSPNLQLRPTCFFALSLIATAGAGIGGLAQCGWVSLRHGKDQKWPVDAECLERSLEKASLGHDVPPSGSRPHSAGPNDPDLAVAESSSASRRPSSALKRRSGSFKRRFSTWMRSFKKPPAAGSPLPARALDADPASDPAAPDSCPLSPEERRSNPEPATANQQQPPESSLGNIAEETPSGQLLEDVIATAQPADEAQPEDGPGPLHGKSTIEDQEGGAHPSANPESAEPESLKEQAAKQEDEAMKAAKAEYGDLVEAAKARRKAGKRARSESEAYPVLSVNAGRSFRTGASTPVGGAQGQSLSSISSLGSWRAGSPGYQTLRNLKNSRRPVLSELEVGEETNAREARSDHSGDGPKDRTRLGPPSESGVPFGVADAGEEDGPVPKYWGITLPVEFDSLWNVYQDHEGEAGAAGSSSDNLLGSPLPDVASALVNSSSSSGHPSPTLSPPTPSDADQADSSVLRQPSPTPASSGTRSRRAAGQPLPGGQDRPTTAFRYHTANNCLSCFRLGAAATAEAGDRIRGTAEGNDGRHGPGDKNGLQEREGKALATVGGNAETQRSIMQWVSVLNSAVYEAEATKRLIRLKGESPGAFRDPCLFSEISLFLAAYPVPPAARRFLQELVSLPSQGLLEEATVILEPGFKP